MLDKSVVIHYLYIVIISDKENMKKEYEEKREGAEESPFRYRSYGKSELASLYLPDILPGSAMREFNEWIAAFPGLAESLRATGLARKSKRYTPAQVRLIAGALGEP